MSIHYISGVCHRKGPEVQNSNSEKIRRLSLSWSGIKTTDQWFTPRRPWLSNNEWNNIMIDHQIDMMNGKVIHFASIARTTCDEMWSICDSA